MRTIQGLHCQAGRLVAALIVGLALTACGGGGGGEAPPPPPPPVATPLPDSVTITAPATAESATAVKFAHSATLQPGYSYRWDFGDGALSTEAAPSHSYAKGGDFEVLLTLSNEAGLKREARVKVVITNLANVKGLRCTGAQDTGWCVQGPRVPIELADGFLWDEQLGWALSGGRIFKTLDGGDNWEAMTQTALSGDEVKFFDANTGWIVGPSRLMRTKDGGRQWTEAAVKSGSTLLDGRYEPVSATTAYFWPSAGSERRYVTTDGGATWRQLTVVPTAVTAGDSYWAISGRSLLYSGDAGLTFKEVLNFDRAGFPAQPGRDVGLVVHPQGAVAAVHTQTATLDPVTGLTTSVTAWVHTTTDRGATWHTVRAGCTLRWENNCYIGSLTSIASDGTLLTSDNGLHRSVDGGKTWSLIPDTNRYSGKTFQVGDTLAFMVYQNPGPVSVSRDGGKTFVNAYSPAVISDLGPTLGTLRFQPATGHLMFQNSGNLFLSKDDGLTWRRIFSSTAGSLYRDESATVPTIAMVNAKRGFIRDLSGVVRETLDGGRTVRRVTTGDLANAQQIQFVTDKVGWFASSVYEAGAFSWLIYRTTDAGQNWTLVSRRPNGELAELRFETETTGWLRWGSALAGYTFQVTQDGGQTWRDVEVPVGTQTLRLAAVPGRWVAVGRNGQIASTGSGGPPWTVAPSGVTDELRVVTASTANTLWAGGGASLLSSKDAGATWTVLPRLCSAGPANELMDIVFVDSRVGWVACKTELFATTDGGGTWQKQATPASEGGFWKITAVDAKTAWVAGAKNVLLATGNGGQ